MKQFVILFALMTPALVFAGGKKTPPASLSFHIEGTAQEGPKFVRKVKTLAGEKHFRKSPEISTRDIIAFSPFPADDKNTYGLILQLNKTAKRRLFTSTSTNRGKLLLTLMNGQAMGVVRVDKPVNDGILVIWSGVTLKEVRQYDLLLPRIGEDKKKWEIRVKEAKKNLKN